MLRLEKAVDEIFLRQKQNGSRLIDICKYFYDNVEEDRSKGSMYANYISRGRANIYKKILNLPCWFSKEKKKKGKKGWSWVKSNCANPRYNELDVTSSPGVGIDLRSIFLSGNRPVS